jgi:hypothetical protein
MVGEEGAEVGPGIPPTLEYTSSYIYAGGGSTRWQHKGRVWVMRPSLHMYKYVHCKIVHNVILYVHTAICTVVAEIID